MKKIFFVMALLSGIFFLSGDAVFSSGSDNKRDAEKYCEQKWAKNEKCKVSKWVGCGTGWTKDKRFNKHRGKDWFACKQTAYDAGSEANQKKCEAYRDSIVKKVDLRGNGFTNKSLFCHPYKTCKVNVTTTHRFKSFEGSGKNYYLCNRSDVTEYAKCGEWCMQNGKMCVKCQYNPDKCPSGSKMTKFFAKNFGACTK